MSSSLFCEKIRNNPLFRYFASLKFATFSHLFASRENLGVTLSDRKQINIIESCGGTVE
jgi:hypothetical protein